MVSLGRGRVKTLLTVVTLVALCGGLFVFWGDSPQKAEAALDVEPRRKVEIIIQSNKVGGSLTDFPVLLTKANIPDEACDADGTSPAQNGGGDIRFTSDEGGNTQLPLEVVDFTTNNDPANCTVEMYVKVPTLSSSSNTSIWMWYDTETTASQPTAASTYGSENVWDSNYKGVWHLDESSGTRNDSTTNDNHLTDNNTVTSGTGKWGTGADFERDNSEYLSITDGSQTGLDITGALTMGFWYKPESDDGIIMGRYNEAGSQTPFWVQLLPGGKVRLGIYSGSTTNTVDSATTLSNGTWYYITGSYTPSTELRIYVNGTSDGVNTTSIVSSIQNSTADFRFSSGVVGGSSVAFADGLLKAGRVSSSTRAAGWITTEYNNQNEPATFAIEQPPQDGSMAPESATVVKSSDQSVSTTTITADNELVFTLKANTKYVINGGVFATSTSAVPDIKIGFDIPSGTMDVGYLAQGGNTRSAELLETDNTLGAEITVPANTNTIIQPFGSVVIGATGGSMTFKWAQASSSGTSVTVKQGSFITVTEVTD